MMDCGIQDCGRLVKQHPPQKKHPVQPQPRRFPSGPEGHLQNPSGAETDSSSFVALLQMEPNAGKTIKHNTRWAKHFCAVKKVNSHTRNTHTKKASSSSESKTVTKFSQWRCPQPVQQIHSGLCHSFFFDHAQHESRQKKPTKHSALLQKTLKGAQHIVTLVCRRQSPPLRAIPATTSRMLSRLRMTRSLATAISKPAAPSDAECEARAGPSPGKLTQESPCLFAPPTAHFTGQYH